MSLGNRLTGEPHSTVCQWRGRRAGSQRRRPALGQVIEGRYLPSYLFNQPNLSTPALLRAGSSGQTKEPPLPQSALTHYAGGRATGGKKALDIELHSTYSVSNCNTEECNTNPTLSVLHQAI